MQDQAFPGKYFVHSLLFDPAALHDKSILIVGVGGIGCELLKVLSKSPIKSIHILDMDTIEISNLNRQFLFKAEHKGKSKALVAKDSINRLNPYLNIEAHHKNIKEMPISFFKEFSFLVMALDNIDARNYVNKIGIRLNIPIIDAGTLAYKGNSRLIIPGLSSCYSCEPKSSSQKSFPVCTIRMRPQKPIHCVVWAKMLFEVLFSHADNQQNIEEKEPVEGDMGDLSELIKKPIQEILDQLFNTEIQTIKNAKTSQDNLLSEMYMKQIQPIPRQTIINSLKSEDISNLDSFDAFDEKIELEKHIKISQLAYDSLFTQKNNEGIILFEKDDDTIMHFISSMANARMKCFSIEEGSLSFNEVKNMAGNIVPAIASTNSIVSGLQVLEMVKFIVYEGKLQYLKSYYVQNQSYKIRGMKMQPPNPECLVCPEKSQPCIIQANFQAFRFKEFISCIKDSLTDVDEYSINVGSKQLYNSEEPRQIILNKTIKQLSNNNLEMELILTNEDTSQKICSIWLIHNIIPVPIILNKNRLLNRQKPFKDQMQEQPINEGNQNDGGQSSDLVEINNEVANNDDDIVEVIPNEKNVGSRMVDERDEDIVKKKRKLE